MAITYDEATGVFSLETANSLYQMRVDECGVLLHLYYGRRTGADMGYLVRRADRGFSGNPYERQDDRAYSLDTLPQEYSGCGVGDFRVSALRAWAENGSRSVDLRYVGYSIHAGAPHPEGLPGVRPDDLTQTLELTLEDAATGLLVRLAYSVYPEEDVITRWASVSNCGLEAMALEKAASACVDFPYGRFDALHFHGRHNMERAAERVRLPRGVTAFGTERGISSHHSNPFVILCERGAGEDAGDCYGFMLMYSGNHLEELEVDQAGSTRVVMGINPAGFRWRLEPGESFDTPQAILAFSDAGFNGLSRCFHRLIRGRVIPPEFRHARCPVLVNSWEASYFDFDADSLLRLAESSAALGIEMLVLDDGWFGHRDDDKSSLGDWVVNEAKLGCPLVALSDRVHALGMAFGLWVEPEMISEDSDLYRTHPDWALSDPGRKPTVARSQLVLDLSREDVLEHVYGALCRILDSTRIEYLKWDFNRPVTNLYSRALPADRQGELGHRMVLGTYSLLERLRRRYPELRIEGCCGGGGRFDAGMLYYCPQIWCSDDTDAIERLEIQRGTSYGYPARVMGAHVSAVPNHQTGRTVPLATRGAVAQSGAFGYELDIGRLSAEERWQVAAQVGEYKRLWHLIAEGDYYRLGELDDGADWAAWMTVSADGSEALVSAVATHVRANGPFPWLRLRGLDPDGRYRLEGVDGLEGQVLTGAAMMCGGVSLPQPMGDYPAVRLRLSRCDRP